ncbi:hypothetical protein IGI04_010364 [Brassica rapa subsp. trilocularis]|uniref:Uncharacterized protein n=1 Tax=Brassica rapa subsp. trilocularis TaxID=1813537 RepID=A0ABQ7N2G7_BRACM|nr:hypothetical protein IGI04_010364 [Brassica rapa subsp. trilocularis]
MFNKSKLNLCHVLYKLQPKEIRLTNDIESEPEVKQSVHTLDEDTSNISPGSYFNNLGLKYFASEPLRMVSRHKCLMESCLENNNPEALKHLRHSAHGIYDKGKKDSRYPGTGTHGINVQLLLEKGHVFKQHGKAQTPKKLRPPPQESSMQKVLLLKGSDVCRLYSL